MFVLSDYTTNFIRFIVYLVRSRSWSRLMVVVIFLMNWLRLFAFSGVFDELIWINEMRSVKVSAHLD